MNTQKKKAGRPKILLDLHEVERLAELGLSDEQVASSMGVSSDTLSRRKRDFAGCAEALQKGRAAGVAHVTNKLRQLVDNGTPSAIYFFLKCKGGWSEDADLQRRLDQLEANINQLIQQKG